LNNFSFGPTSENALKYSRKAFETGLEKYFLKKKKKGGASYSAERPASGPLAEADLAYSAFPISSRTRAHGGRAASWLTVSGRGRHVDGMWLPR